MCEACLAQGWCLLVRLDGQVCVVLGSSRFFVNWEIRCMCAAVLECESGM